MTKKQLIKALEDSSNAIKRRDDTISELKIKLMCNENDYYARMATMRDKSFALEQIVKLYEKQIEMLTGGKDMAVQDQESTNSEIEHLKAACERWEDSFNRLLNEGNTQLRDYQMKIEDLETEMSNMKTYIAALEMAVEVYKSIIETTKELNKIC